MKAALSITLALALVGGLAIAQERGGPPPGGGPGGPGRPGMGEGRDGPRRPPPALGPLDRALEEANLSPEERAQLNDIRRDHVERMKAVHEETRRQLVALLGEERLKSIEEAAHAFGPPRGGPGGERGPGGPGGPHGGPGGFEPPPPPPGDGPDGPPPEVR